MWRTAASKALQPWRMLASSRLRSTKSDFSVVNSMLLRSLKEHYREVDKLNPPPKVNPPTPFSVVKGALKSGGPVLKRDYGEEKISISVMRLVNIIPGGGDGDDDDGINQLFLHVDVSKPGQNNALHFLCGLYPDALGIHSVQMRSKQEDSSFLMVPTKYNGPTFQELDEKMRDALHGYIEERGINESLFPFLQAWLYVTDHQKLLKWFSSVGTVISESKYASASVSDTDDY